MRFGDCNSSCNAEGDLMTTWASNSAFDSAIGVVSTASAWRTAAIAALNNGATGPTLQLKQNGVVKRAYQCSLVVVSGSGVKPASLLSCSVSTDACDFTQAGWTMHFVQGTREISRPISVGEIPDNFPAGYGGQAITAGFLITDPVAFAGGGGGGGSGENILRTTLQTGKKYRAIMLKQGAVPNGSFLRLFEAPNGAELTNYQVHLTGGWLDGSYSLALVWTDLPSSTSVDFLRGNLAPTPTGSVSPSASTSYVANIDGTDYIVALDASDLTVGNREFAGPLCSRYRVRKTVPLPASDTHVKLYFDVDQYSSGAQVNAFLSNADASQSTAVNYTCKLTNANNVVLEASGGAPIILHYLVETPPLRIELGAAFTLAKYETSFGYDATTKVLPPYKGQATNATLKAWITATYGGINYGANAIGRAPANQGTGAERLAIGWIDGASAVAYVNRDSATQDYVLDQSLLDGLWSGNTNRQADGSPSDYGYTAVWPAVGDANFNNSSTKVSPVPSQFPAGYPLRLEQRHIPHFSFYPALQSGEKYHLERVQYRGLSAPLLYPDNGDYRIDKPYVQAEPRGPAWVLASELQAWILQPVGPIKTAFQIRINRQLEGMLNAFTNPTDNPTNPLHLYAPLISDYSETDASGRQIIAPWMLAYLGVTCAMAVNWGFTAAIPVLEKTLGFIMACSTANRQAVATALRIQTRNASNVVHQTLDDIVVYEDPSGNVIAQNTAPIALGALAYVRVIKAALGAAATAGLSGAAAAFAFWETNYPTSGASNTYTPTSHSENAQEQIGNKWEMVPTGYSDNNYTPPART
jgi:hypothetical protein